MKQTLNARPVHALRAMTDQQWLAALLASIKNPNVLGVEFPRFPADAMQSVFVGSANETALGEAFYFYTYMKEWAAKLGKPITPSSTILDFGCGWGRFLRFFWKDVDEENMHGVDVSREAIEICQTTGVPGNLTRIEPLGTLPFADASVDHMLAYSVFTHLSEKSHLHWLAEVKRVMKPGGMMALTLEPRRFLEWVVSLANHPDKERHPWYKILSEQSALAQTLLPTFDAGGICFLPSNGEKMGEFYGDTATPLTYIEQHWGPEFKVIDYVDDPQRFWQAPLVVQRV